MNCSICNLPTGNIVGSVLPQCKCGWQAPNPPATQRPWVGLTMDELNMIGDRMRTWNSLSITDVYTAIEAKLKEKNNA